MRVLINITSLLDYQKDHNNGDIPGYEFNNFYQQDKLIKTGQICFLLS